MSFLKFVLGFLLSLIVPVLTFAFIPQSLGLFKLAAVVLASTVPFGFVLWSLLDVGKYNASDAFVSSNRKVKKDWDIYYGPSASDYPTQMHAFKAGVMS